jgi:DtxR family Mn-dependent transcriptional regulator
MAEWHPATEEYCEAIYGLAEDDIEVVQARIVERLEVSRAAVSEMVRRLGDEGLVVSRDGVISLTAEGRRIAEQVVRRHRLAERFLTDVLGLSWAQAHTEAGKWEHIISEPVEAALVQYLGEPTTCPHGNPIPGTDYRERPAMPLVAVPTDEEFVLERIPEELEWAKGQLEYLEDAGFAPGVRGRVRAIAPDGTMTVDVDGRSIGLGEFISNRILVSRVD